MGRLTHSLNGSNLLLLPLLLWGGEEGRGGRSGDYSAGEGGKANDILVTSKKEIDENNLQCNRFIITLLFWYLLINLVLYIC